MRRETTEDQVREWCATAARAASSKNGSDTVILGVGHLLAITDAFVITGGASARQVRAITEAVEDAVKAAGGPPPLRIEGLDDARWVLMDFGDFVVHVFGDEARRFYDLEQLWADADPWPWAGADPPEAPAGDVQPAWAAAD
ncbi:MAG: ribosome silencing factor [Acidimicrobiales bacterium]